MLIYKIQNIKNNKVYIGQTILSANRRWNIHKNCLRKQTHVNHHLQFAWNKYEESNFVFEIIEVILFDKEYLNQQERYWIQYYNSTDQQFGYNIEAGGNMKKEISVETRAKISAANKGRKYTLEQNAKNSASKKGRVHSEETKLKISQARKGKSPTLEHRIKLSKSQTMVWSKRKNIT